MTRLGAGSALAFILLAALMGCGLAAIVLAAIVLEASRG